MTTFFKKKEEKFLQSEFLTSNRLFDGMTQGERAAALDALCADCRSYEKGEAILHAGDRTSCVCVVLGGSVAVESNDVWGNRTVLNVMAAGDFFAESYAVLRDEPLLVDAVANERCEVLFLRVGELFEGPFEGASVQPWQHKLLRNLLAVSARKNLMLSGRSFHISPKTARGRIMAYLNSVSLKKRSKIFDIPFDRRQMADHLNLDRTALSKELGKMKREGIVDFHKNHFKIL